MSELIPNERLAKLLQFTKTLVDANKCGVYEVPLLANPAEAFEALAGLALSRGLVPGPYVDGMLTLVPKE